ncbi:MAG: DUF4388 domain-containing protein [Deferrisomatales bacterium]|nr:DUF4388 domain-containing protein [Deferrisomatales bacterium]
MELRGSLEDFSLPDIIQLVGSGRKTGVLRLQSPQGSAALFFEGGKVVHVEALGAQGEEAVSLLFDLPGGSFRFQTDVPPSLRTIALDPAKLVLEAARLADEGRSSGVPVREPCHNAQAGAPTAPGELKPRLRALLRRRLGDGAGRLLQAVERCGETPEDVLRLADQVERYVYFFLDEEASGAVAQEIRELVSAPP